MQEQLFGALSANGPSAEPSAPGSIHKSRAFSYTRSLNASRVSPTDELKIKLFNLAGEELKTHFTIVLSTQVTTTAENASGKKPSRRSIIDEVAGNIKTGHADDAIKCLNAYILDVEILPGPFSTLIKELWGFIQETVDAKFPEGKPVRQPEEVYKEINFAVFDIFVKHCVERAALKPKTDTALIRAGSIVKPDVVTLLQHLLKLFSSQYQLVEGSDLDLIIKDFLSLSSAVAHAHAETNAVKTSDQPSGIKTPATKDTLTKALDEVTEVLEAVRNKFIENKHENTQFIIMLYQAVVRAFYSSESPEELIKQLNQNSTRIVQLCPDLLTEFSDVITKTTELKKQITGVREGTKSDFSIHLETTPTAIAVKVSSAVLPLSAASSIPAATERAASFVEATGGNSLDADINIGEPPPQPPPLSSVTAVPHSSGNGDASHYDGAVKAPSADFAAATEPQDASHADNGSIIRSQSTIGVHSLKLSDDELEETKENETGVKTDGATVENHGVPIIPHHLAPGAADSDSAPQVGRVSNTHGAVAAQLTEMHKKGPPDPRRQGMPASAAAASAAAQPNADYDQKARALIQAFNMEYQRQETLSNSFFSHFNNARASKSAPASADPPRDRLKAYLQHAARTPSRADETRSSKIFTLLFKGEDVLANLRQLHSSNARNFEEELNKLANDLPGKFKSPTNK